MKEFREKVKIKPKLSPNLELEKRLTKLKKKGFYLATIIKSQYKRSLNSEVGVPYYDIEVTFTGVYGLESTVKFHISGDTAIELKESFGRGSMIGERCWIYSNGAILDPIFFLKMA